MSLVTERSGLSPNFLNPRLVYTATGDQILALGTSNTPKLQICSQNSSNGALTQDKVYFRKSDNTLQVLNLVRHYHDADTDDAGGLLLESLYRNIGTTINIQQVGAMLLASHINIVGTNASVTADFDNGTVAGGKVNLNTGEYANNVANVRTGGYNHDWAQKSKFNIVCQVGGSANLVVRAGINVEPLTLTNDVDKKCGMEYCDSTGPYWNIFSSNGTRSLLATTYPGSTTKQGYQILHTPATSTRMSVASGGYVIKSSDCPGSGVSDSKRLLGFGIKTTEPVTKNLYVWGITFSAAPSGFYF